MTHEQAEAARLLAEEQARQQATAQAANDTSFLGDFAREVGVNGLLEFAGEAACASVEAAACVAGAVGEAICGG